MSAAVAPKSRVEATSATHRRGELAHRHRLQEDRIHRDIEERHEAHPEPERERQVPLRVLHLAGDRPIWIQPSLRPEDRDHRDAERGCRDRAGTPSAPRAGTT